MIQLLQNSRSSSEVASMSLWTQRGSPTALIEETLKARKLGDAASIGH